MACYCERQILKLPTSSYVKDGHYDTNGDRLNPIGDLLHVDQSSLLFSGVVWDNMIQGSRLPRDKNSECVCATCMST